MRITGSVQQCCKTRLSAALHVAHYAWMPQFGRFSIALHSCLDRRFNCTTACMHRYCLTFVMSLLLLGMQQEAQLHALSHAAGLLYRPYDVGLQPQVADKACEKCVLLSGGSHALPLAAQSP